jgi:hypothetical protein
MAYNAKVSFLRAVAEETRFPTLSNRVLSSFPRVDRNHRLLRCSDDALVDLAEMGFPIRTMMGRSRP